MYPYLNQIFSKHQWRCRKRYNAQHDLMALIEKWYKFLDIGGHGGVLLTQQTFIGLQDVLKTSLRHVLKISSTLLQRNNFSSSKTSWIHLARPLEEVLEDEKLLRWKRLEDFLKTCLEDVLKTCLEDVLKTCLEDMSWRRLEDMSWRRLEDISWRRLQDVLEANKMFTGDICT